MTIKDDLADHGLDTLVEWCTLNKVPLPKVNLYKDPSSVECRRIKAVGTCGYYRNNVMHVGIPLCASPNPMYSWPGFISDRTPFGVIQHELGHHVDQIKTGTDLYRRQKDPTLNNVPTPGNYYSDHVRGESGEAPITSYSPNTMEWFAEIFRLFVTNPTLLALIRPRAFDIISKDFTPSTELDDMEVLALYKAPAKIYERRHKWLTSKK